MFTKIKTMKNIINFIRISCEWLLNARIELHSKLLPLSQWGDTIFLVRYRGLKMGYEKPSLVIPDFLAPIYLILMIYPKIKKEVDEYNPNVYVITKRFSINHFVCHWSINGGKNYQNIGSGNLQDIEEKAEEFKKLGFKDITKKVDDEYNPSSSVAWPPADYIIYG